LNTNLLDNHAAINTRILRNQFKWIAQGLPYNFSPDLEKEKGKKERKE
jgi:hypothetical protein